ncbi:MAG TPA: methyltransferase, partial [Rhodocyclaceae bacterium]|nr:methyltransferase [Rhodocyclaceae bacterium]
MSEHPRIQWTLDGQEYTARWRSEAALPPPKKVLIADDTINADTAFRYACEGTALLWQGDFQNARQLLLALARRADRPSKKGQDATRRPTVEYFHLHRQAQAQRARTLGSLLVPLNADYGVPLRRAPDVTLACSEAYG